MRVRDLNKDPNMVVKAVLDSIRNMEESGSAVSKLILSDVLTRSWNIFAEANTVANVRGKETDLDIDHPKHKVSFTVEGPPAEVIAQTFKVLGYIATCTYLQDECASCDNYECGYKAALKYLGEVSDD